MKLGPFFLRPLPWWLIGLGVALLAVGLLAGCGMDKATEPYRDAPVDGRNSDGAVVIEMPDGFSNMATKCDHGNRVYVAFKGDANRAAVAVVPADPTCSR